MPLIDHYNWNVQIAIAIMRAESGCNASAIGTNTNGTNDEGLMQINSIHVKSGLIADQERLDPAANIRAAYAIYSGSGWRAWSAFNNGAYMKYL